METAATRTEQWHAKERQACDGGDTQARARQEALGKQHARTRIDHLLDPGSFIEIDRLVCSAFGTSKNYTDGVVAGLGTIHGRHVAVYAQDFTLKGGSLGKHHAAKICKVMDMAAKIGCPIIGIIDSGGARIDEGIHALAGYGKIFKRNCHYSGIIPQISLIMGPCAGGAVYSPALTDIIFMTSGTSQMFVTGPNVIAQATHQTITKEDLGGAEIHTTISGVAHDVCATEDECLEKVKALLEYLPNSYLDQPPRHKTVEPSQQSPLHIPEHAHQALDIITVITSLVDHESFFELQPRFAANMVTGFARMDGMVVGIVANQPAVKAGVIDIEASSKAARFIRLCDSFGIPLVTLVDTPGYLPGVEQEHSGIIRHGAKLLYAYATATVPKITVILRKAFGGAFIVMGSKELGGDINYAWPMAHIAVLGAQAAVAIMHGKKLAATPAENRLDLQHELEHAYQEEFLNPFTAAEHGYIDAIIEPSETRMHIIKALHLTKDKVEKLPPRKHGNMPL
ncbi:MAG: acyl-CoA carboxylase subunit beta [Candidatus Babeliales bacterium]|jgi:propionyl-CoA carboxylase beta chain